MIMTQEKSEYEQDIQKLADYYGFDNQSDKTIEECAELIQAIEKYKENERNNYMNEDEKQEYRQHMIEEIADVQIMLDQLVYLLNCEEEMKKVIEYKVKRQLERIRKEKEQIEKIKEEGCVE